MSTDRSIGLRLFCCEEGFRMWQFQLKVGMPCLILWKCVYIFPLRHKKEANFKAIFLNHKARLHNNQASSTILNNVQGRASLWNHLELSYLSCLFFVFVSSFFFCGGGGGGGRTNYSFTILSLFYFNAKRVLPWFCPGTHMYFVQLVLFICCGKFASILLRENMHLFLFVFAFLCPPFPWQSLTTVSVCYFDFAFWDFPRLNQFSRDRRGMNLPTAHVAIAFGTDNLIPRLSLLCLHFCATGHVTACETYFSTTVESKRTLCQNGCLVERISDLCHVPL